jgi:hypothetical protein
MSAAGVGGDAADAAQKRVRALQKKLRQIQQLKDKRDNEGETWGSKRGLVSATACAQLNMQQTRMLVLSLQDCGAVVGIESHTGHGDCVQDFNESG